jgi:hypothetical protein
MDPDSAQRLRYLIWERLQSETDCLGIGCNRDVRGEFRKFLAGDRVFVDVQVYIGQDNMPEVCHLRFVEGPGVPAANITIDGDSVLYWGRQDDQYQSMLATIETHLSSGFILPKLHMPYGYVQDGIVIAIWYAQLLDGYIPGALRTRTMEFALQGHDLPVPLLESTGDAETYTQKYWGLMRSGNIIELGERVMHHPSPLWFVSSSWPQLTFTRNDGKLPILPAGMPYLLRLASDPIDSDLPRTRQLVAEYLHAGAPPENLSDFFTPYI